MDISQGNFCARIYRFYSEKAGDHRAYHSEKKGLQHLLRTPQCGHTVWGTTDLQLVAHVDAPREVLPRL